MIYTKIGSFEHARDVLTKLESDSSVRWGSFNQPVAGSKYFIEHAVFLIFLLGEHVLQYNDDEARMKRYFEKRKEQIKLVTPNAFIEHVAAACPKEKVK